MDATTLDERPEECPEPTSANCEARKKWCLSHGSRQMPEVLADWFCKEVDDPDGAKYAAFISTHQGFKNYC